MTTPTTTPDSSHGPDRSEPTPSSRDAAGRRAGATWVAATGAALVLAAATVFVAVSWDQIPDMGKFAMLLTVTGGCFGGGLALRRTLPATGSVLTHLGALLVPANVGAANLEIGLGWRGLLLLEGVVALVVFGSVARLLQSRVLAAAATAAGLACAAGIAANTDVPAPILVAAAAAALLAARRHQRCAISSACAAAVAPLSAYAFDLITIRGDEIIGRGVATELGVLGVGPAWSLIAGIFVAATIAIAARRNDRPALLSVAAVGIVAHGISATRGAEVDSDTRWISIAALFVLIELCVLAARRDRFYAPITKVAADVVEGFALLAAGWGVTAAFAEIDLRSDVIRPNPSVAVAYGLLAVGFVVAGLRRACTPSFSATQWRSSAWSWLDAAAAGSAVAALVHTDANPSVLAGAMLGISVVWFASNRRGSEFAHAVVVAAVSVADHDSLSGFGFAGAAIALCIAVAHAHAGRGSSNSAVHGAASLVWLAVATTTVAPHWGAMGAATVAVVGLGIIALAFTALSPEVARTARVLAACSPIIFAWLPLTEVWMPSTALTILVGIEVWRTREARFGFAAVGPMVLLELAAAHSIDLTLATSGLAIIAAAFVWGGFAVLLPPRVRDPFIALGAVSALVGSGLAMTSLATAGPALIALGGAALGAGVLLRRDPLQQLAGAMATIGIWLVLAERSIAITEAFLAPVAVQLIVTGIVVRARHPHGEVSSWLAYVPGLVMLTAPAMLERMTGGVEEHALFAGAVAVVAVAVGGWGRQVGTLMTGTLVLGIVTIHESLSAGVYVPTWVWLGAGGAALLGAAVAMERSDTSPVEAGRRIVDIVSEHFD